MEGRTGHEQEVHMAQFTHTNRAEARTLSSARPLARACSHAVFFIFEPMPLPQPRIGLGCGRAIHLSSDEILIGQA